jgi:ABC-type cobalamin/Fe3+-siderophores transport system ATPase subunit
LKNLKFKILVENYSKTITFLPQFSYGSKYLSVVAIVAYSRYQFTYINPLSTKQTTSDIT